MPLGSHQLQSTPVKACRAVTCCMGHCPSIVFLLLLNGCCPWGCLSLEPFILVCLSSLSLCSLHLHVMLQFLAWEHEVTWLLEVVAKPLSTWSTLAVPSARAIGLPCSMVCNPYATALHCTKIHWLRPIACSFTMGSCHMLCYRVLCVQMCLDQQPTLVHTHRWV